jgi:outer membrane protein assembly factor BamB
MFTVVLSLPMLLTITGCQDWPKFHYDAANTGYNTKEFILNTSNVKNLTLIWSQTGSSNFGFGSPVVSGIVLYVGSGDGTLYAFNAFTGAPSWSVKVGDTIQSTPAVCPTCTTNGLVFFGSYDKNVYAFDITTHQKVWSKPTGDIITSSATVANGNVYIGSEDKKLYGFVAATGAPLPGFPVTTGGGVYAVPAVSGNSVYAMSKDGYLYAFNASTGGPYLWRTALSGASVSSPSVDVVNNAVYVAGNLALYAVNTTDGSVKWQAPVKCCGEESSPAVANGLVYTTTRYANSSNSGGYVYAFPTTYNAGKPVWSVFLGNAFYPADVSVANGVTYVGMSYFVANYPFFQEIQALDALKGTTLWVSPAGSCVGGAGNPQTTVANGLVYAAGETGPLCNPNSVPLIYAFGL